MKNWVKISIHTLLAQLVIYYFIVSTPGLVDQIIVPYIFHPVSALLRQLTGWIPFSIGLILAFILTGWLVFQIIIALRQIYQDKTNAKSLCIHTIAILSPILFLYMITWGFLYYRTPISTQMKLDTSPIVSSELTNLVEDLIKDANHLRSEIKDESLENLNYKQVEQIAAKSFIFLPKEYTKNKNLFAKKAAGSTLLAYMGTAGIYTFWSGEANVNKILVPQDLPDVMLHEMAHQLGFASEDEASFIAWLAGKDHPDKIFRYSVTSKLLWRSLRTFYLTDSTTAAHYVSQVDSVVIKDQFHSAASWEPYRNLIGDNIIRPVYSLFLKANGEKEGIQAYDRVVDLVIYERRPRLEPNHGKADLH